mmetsp:Transcript_19651/g.63169  ORF Transcript_19651/g.63169 Transcript_19651/m.63169 type:complete len:213 (+) Transcript_19651:79-717(+)|eukprot:CAMPEP_0118892984 /NCGR_PEP_ID=MMETSP1166-20130328/2371_1 /TAXON_ID=1104430 /ORGANISM="Chrysoreinhardia sp, Strain CCMP3193" /LENGTH=212 /DNA_ID=CAMNT_0006831753 /DNA_START=67 /DNA_END=702 /DNA_ORIENTATION=-
MFFFLFFFFTSTARAYTSPALRRSEALPWLSAPPVLDGSVVGDVGFDPLHFAKSQALLSYFREAEIKHARLAMLATVGWVVSEMLDPPLAKLCGLPCVLARQAFAPSTLNGGLAEIHPVFWGVSLGSASAFELYSLYLMLQKKALEPGDLQFDPLGFYPTERSRRRRMQLAEIKHGRLAMVAVVGFAAEEFILGTPVVQHSSAFFTPFWDYW